MIRPKSANDIETKGMIGLLLEAKDEIELENLGLKASCDDSSLKLKEKSHVFFRA